MSVLSKCLVAMFGSNPSTGSSCLSALVVAVIPFVCRRQPCLGLFFFSNQVIVLQVSLCL